MTSIFNRLAPVVVVFGLLTGTSMAKLNVVATTADFGAVASEIGGDHVEVFVLARPTEDPHFVDPKPSFIAKLARADVLVEGGAELEIGWLPPLLDGARNTRITSGKPGRIACAEGQVLLEVPAVLDRSHGDLHVLGNPHFMMDPERALRAAERIRDGLAAVDPAHDQHYRNQYDVFAAELDAKLSEWRQRLTPFEGRRVVAYHDAWPYFAERFGLRIDLFLEPKPGIPPTPAHLAEIIQRMKSESLDVILVEPYQNRRTAETAAEKTGAVVLNFTQYPGGRPGTEDGYLAMMDYLVDTLASALASRDQATEPPQ